MIDLCGHIIDIPGAKILIVIHKNHIDATAVPLGDVPGPLLQFLPLVKGEQVADVKDIVHRGAVRFLRILTGRPSSHFIAAVSRCEKVRHEFRHSVHRLGKRHGAHIHIAGPCPRLHAGFH